MPKNHVLDTCVLVSDPQAVFSFEENRVVIPQQLLRELDGLKKGKDEVARNARAASRILDELTLLDPKKIREGISLKNGGKIAFVPDAPRQHFKGLEMEKDNRILDVALMVQKERPDEEVVLVSKDGNVRIMARILGLAAQDYHKDKVIDDSDLLDTGYRLLAEADVRVERTGTKGAEAYCLTGPGVENLFPRRKSLSTTMLNRIKRGGSAARACGRTKW